MVNSFNLFEVQVLIFFLIILIFIILIADFLI